MHETPKTDSAPPETSEVGAKAETETPAPAVVPRAVRLRTIGLTSLPNSLPGERLARR